MLLQMFTDYDDADDNDNEALTMFTDDDEDDDDNNNNEALTDVYFPNNSTRSVLQTKKKLQNAQYV